MNTRGSGLILAFLVAAVVTIWSGGMLTASLAEGRASLRAVSSLQAFHAAEAGLDRALHALQVDSQYAGNPYEKLGERSGGYTINAAPSGLNQWVVRATGFYPSDDVTAYGYTARTVEAVVELITRAGPGYGVLGDRSVEFNSAVDDEVTLDSYDSRQGSYQGGRGHVRLCANAHEEKTVALIGGATVNGDVVLGPGSDPETALWQTPRTWTTITGSVTVADRTTPLEPVELPDLADVRSVQIAGHEVMILPGGLYRFRELHISGHGQLVFTGPAEIYVDEDVRLSGHGAIDTYDHRPTNLALYVKGDHVVLNSDADCFAKVSAPSATIELSGEGDLYGVLNGRAILVHGRGDVHYDEALNLYDEALSPPATPQTPQANILSWREVLP